MSVQLACTLMTDLLDFLSRPSWADWQVHAFSAELQQKVHAALIRHVANNKQPTVPHGCWVPRILAYLGRC